MYDITALRQQEFPISAHTIYFNHASISPLPERARRKMHWATDRLAESPMIHSGEEGGAMFRDFQREVAAYLNAASPDEIVPVLSTSTGLNAIAQAMAWQPGDNLAFCELEFPSNAYPWMSLERDGVEARQVPAVDGGLTLEALAPLVDARTRLVAASAVQFFSGHRAELAAIGDFCQQRGIVFAVDAMQAAGHIPLDVQAMGIDVLAAGSQKSLMGPPGAGFMYVRGDFCEALRPRHIGPNATLDYIHWLKYDITPHPGALRFLMGTINQVGMFGTLESLRLLDSLGRDHIDAHTTQLAAEAIEGLAARGYELITAREAHGPIVTFAPGLDEAGADALVAYFRQQHVSVVKHLNPQDVPHLRLSFHCYNTREELAEFLRLLDAYAAA